MGEWHLGFGLEDGFGENGGDTPPNHWGTSNLYHKRPELAWCLEELPQQIKDGELGRPL